MGGKKQKACAIKGGEGGVLLVIFVMGGGYGGREAQEAGGKNIEEEGEERGALLPLFMKDFCCFHQHLRGALLPVFPKALDFLLLPPNEAQAEG